MPCSALARDLSSSFAEEEKELNNTKIKLTEASEYWSFAKEIGNNERAKKKMIVAIDLEDEIEGRTSKNK